MEKEVIYINSTEAIKITFQAGVGEKTPATIYNWCRQYKLGIKVGGQWRIDKNKFETFLKGNSK